MLCVSFFNGTLSVVMASAVVLIVVASLGRRLKPQKLFWGIKEQLISSSPGNNAIKTLF